MSSPCGMDTKKWREKRQRAEAVLNPLRKQMVSHGVEMVYRKAAENLEGPYYGPGGRGPGTGKIPVPRLTTALRRSLTKNQVDETDESLGVVYTDHKVAPHDVSVHQGNRRTRPRRFLGNAFLVMKIPVYKTWITMFRNALSKEGQK